MIMISGGGGGGGAMKGPFVSQKFYIDLQPIELGAETLQSSSPNLVNVDD